VNIVENKTAAVTGVSPETGANLFFIFLILIILLGSPNICLAETPVEEMHRYLVDKANFAGDDFSKLENGELITKLLPVQDKREVGVCGLIQIKAPPDQALQAFQDAMARQNRKSVMEFGSFSSTPNIEDLKNLTLEDNDIEDLKQCQAGKCQLRLSANMIGRFQKEIDWNAPDYRKQATNLFRHMILNYVSDYLSRGDAALIEYIDKRDVVSLQQEYGTLLKELLWVNEYAPELSRYLQNFPAAEPLNVKKSISWSKIKFGLKPVIVITQTITYTSEKNDGLSQVLSVSKQIYANHYFDSSLGLTALISFPNTDTAPDSYLLYTNHSRSSSLDGAFSKFVRGVVEQKAIGKLEPLLQDTKYLAEAKFTDNDEPPDPSAKLEFTESIFGQNYFILVLILIGALFAGFRISKQIAKKRDHL